MLTYNKLSLYTVQHYFAKALLFVAMFVAAEMRNEPSDSKSQDIRMKGAKPEQAEEYLCTGYPLSEEKSYIYKFEALANASTVHHMILYGCSGAPYSEEPVWSCDSMCKGGSQTIIFSWAKNAPHTVLPEGVGFRIGSASTVRTLVIQVHYAKGFNKEDSPDYSGLRIYTTSEEQPFVAGIYLLGGFGFTVPKGNPSYPVDVSCEFHMKQSIFPFAFRPHAHNLGSVITGYLYNGSYYEIGKGNPRWPQAFYPIHSKIEVKPGDSLAARCTYDSTSTDHDVSVGSTGKDEMCNFYIMFYTDKSVMNPAGSCWGNSKPELTGSNFPSDVSVPLPPNPALEEDAKGSHHHASSTATVDLEPQSLNTTWTMDILMKDAKPNKPDAYLCAAYPVADEEAFIYKFEALANASIVHHILVYGCDGEAYSDKPIWQCPMMCRNYASTIMFAWAKNAPPTVLPKDVGLRIGQRSPIKTIVLQVHYAKPFPDEAPPDHSGIRVYLTQKKQPFVAGIFFLGSAMFSIPPGESSYPVDVSCSFNMEKSIFPFAYRTHAHGLGKVITGYQYNGTYQQIGKGNPQWPQAFYPVKDMIEVKPGDSLAARCTYDSTSMHDRVNVGSTGNDEMCNFYIMFYTDSSVQNPSGQCNGDDIHSLTGDNFPAGVSEPLPPNPELEETAKGHHHHGHPGVADSQAQPTQPTYVLTTQDLLMRQAKPDKPESYLCTAYPVQEEESYILKFEAIANVSTVHHILLYGCNGEPFSSEPHWNCPPVCKFGKMSIMFAWAKNAPPTVFPEGVGMRIGQKSQITTIVLQVHYSRAFDGNEPVDHSGVRIYTTTQKQPYVAGIYLMAANSFTIPPGNPSYPVDMSCQFFREKSIFPFMYRTHAHNLGKVITGYQYNGSYHQIGKGNPHWPQAFYPVKDKIEVKPGDYLAARCTYDSTSVGHTVGVGPHGDDEMCNMYIMFYTDSSEANPYIECVRNSRPQLTGDNFPSDVSLPLPPNPALEEEAKGHHHAASEAEDSKINGIHFEHKLEFNSSWPSKNLMLGQIGGVATDKDGNVYIFHRGSRTWTAQSFTYDNYFTDQSSPIQEDVIVVLNSQGQLVRKFGAGQYFMPHGIEVDKDGNIWLTDVALHQVFKISHGETTPSLVLGHRFHHGSDVTSFCKPTDVAVLSSGEFFVSDGYCNGRVMKFSQNGTLIKAWGERQEFAANPPPIGTFDIPHSITVSEENHLVCVADRENGRVQCFDFDGNFRHLIKHPEFGNRLFAIEQSPVQGGVLYAVNGPAFSGLSDTSVQGFTLDIRTGALLETWNIPQHLQNPHDVCVHTGSQSVYVGELNPGTVWKLSRQSATAETNTPVHVHIIKKPNAPDHTGNKVEEHTTAPTNKHEEAGKLMPGAAQNKTSVVISKETESEKSDITPAVLIGCLLVIPVILLLIIILLVRARHSGKLKCCGHNKKRVFSLQGILGNSHKGFDPLNTEESDRDSDNEEYMAPKKIKNKS